MTQNNYSSEAEKNFVNDVLTIIVIYSLKIYNTPAMPASPIVSNYPFNEQWAPLAVYG